MAAGRYRKHAFERCQAADGTGLNGHILLIHLGTSDLRSDKFYDRLDGLIGKLLEKGYTFTALK